MKSSIKMVTLALVVTFFSATLISAQEENHLHKTDDKMENHQMMDVKKIDKNNDGLIYVCPMKCEAPKDQPGECSKCGMKLSEVSIDDVNKNMMEKEEKMGCCSGKGMMGDKDKMMKEHGGMMDHGNMDHSKMESSIVRKGVIDVASIDNNGDGKVFQDPMDWNVISDEAGECPVCGMTLKEVSLDDANKNLEKHGFKIK